MAILAGCHAGGTADQHVDLRVGGVATVTLPVTAGTGYAWAIDAGRSTGASHVVVTGGETKVPGDRVGRPGEQYWQLQGHSIGDADIVFVYRRPWLKDAAPVKSTTVRVEVR
jgi:predicted secreted protein